MADNATALPAEEGPLDLCVKALVERMKAAGQFEDAKLVTRLLGRLEHTQYWYATRHERLWHWAHAELSEQQRHRYFSIVANGTADVSEPPTYAQQFNRMQWRMEEAERQLAALQQSAGIQQAGTGPLNAGVQHRPLP